MLLDRTALDRERQTLELENRKLKLLLKQYLDGKGGGQHIRLLFVPPFDAVRWVLESCF